jgi:hypothetical protein
LKDCVSSQAAGGEFSSASRFSCAERAIFFNLAVDSTRQIILRWKRVTVFGQPQPKTFRTAISYSLKLSSRKTACGMTQISTGAFHDSFSSRPQTQIQSHAAWHAGDYAHLCSAQ